MAAEVKEIIINVKTNVADSSRSIASLKKGVAQLSAVYLKLSDQDAKSAKGLKILEAIKELNEELTESQKKFKEAFQTGTKEAKKMDGAVDELAQDANKLGDALKEAFEAERLIGFTKGLQELTQEGVEAGDAMDKLADGLSVLGPKGQAAAEILKIAFSEINKEINATIGGADKLKNSFNGAIAVVKDVFVSTITGGIMGTGKAIVNAGKTFSQEALRTQEVTNAKRKALILNSNREIIEAEIELQDKIQADNNKSFEEQKTALTKRYEGEAKLSALLISIADAETTEFLNQKNVRLAIEKNGITDITKLNKEAVIASGVLTEEQQAKFLELSAVKDREERRLASKRAEYEKDSTERFIEERERVLNLERAKVTKIVENNQFLLDNTRKSLQEELKLQEENFNAEQNLKDLEKSKLLASLKFDVQRAKDLENEKAAAVRENELKKQQIRQAFAEREIALLEESVKAQIAVNEKAIELGRITLEARLKLEQENTNALLKINEEKLATLNRNDKEFEVKQEALLNERTAIEQKSIEDIANIQIAFLNQELALQVASLEKQTLLRENYFAGLQNDLKETENDLADNIDTLTRSSEKNVFNAIANFSKLRKAYIDAFQTRIQTLVEEAKKTQELSQLQQKVNSANIASLEKQLIASENLSEETKNGIKAQIEVLKAQNAGLSENDRTVQIQLKADVKATQKQLKDDLKQTKVDLVNQISDGLGLASQGFAQLNEFSNIIIDSQLEGQKKVLDERIKGIDELVDAQTKAISVIEGLEETQNGARRRRLDKQKKALEKNIEDELKRKQELEKAKEDAEKKAAQKRKIFSIGEIIIKTAQAVVESVAISPETFGLPFSAFAAATGLAQLAVASGVQFARGGSIDLKNGSMIVGNSHANGGVTFGIGGGFAEADGVKGEAYIVNTKNSPALKRMASDLNVAGGGKAFYASGGVAVSSITPNFESVSKQSTNMAIFKDILQAVKEQKPVLAVRELRKTMADIDRQESVSVIR